MIDHCLTRGLSWESPVQNVCDERHYYEQLLISLRRQKRLFPYHLGEYVCRVLRVTPFAFYCDILVDSMKADSAYDTIPNFTAADIASVVGVGRNEYISIMNEAKSKVLWRVNKGLVRDLLPATPQNSRPRDPSCLNVCVVNLGEVEYRTMSQGEGIVCRMAANHADGVPYGEVDAEAVASLHARGLVWFHVPINASDHVTIPPLEGFVSNKTASASIDPLETLLYQIFVAASESVTVSELAEILDTSIADVRVGLSMACRLGFCKKLRKMDGTSGAQSAQESSHAARDGEEPKRSTAFVVDSAITGFLMMGALTPEVKKHSVTLFEGGRVYGAGVIDELVRGLESSVKLSEGFEGEMRQLGRTSRSMAAVLRCLRAASSTELLRKESIEQLADKEQAERILVRSHDVLICATNLTGPALPLKDASSNSGSYPTLFGPSPMCITPWINVALYGQSGAGPKSIVMPAGIMLETDNLFRGAANVLVWRWDDAHAPRTLDARTALFEINVMLQTTAIMIQPIPASLGDSNCSGPVFVPLPFARNGNGSVDAFKETDGVKIPIEVSADVEAALETMGLLHNVGYLSFLPPVYHGRDLGDDSESNLPWVPLGVSLGIPVSLHPGLCEAVCERLTTMSFLNPEALSRQRQYCANLDARILETMSRHFAATHDGWPSIQVVVGVRS